MMLSRSKRACLLPTAAAVLFLASCSPPKLDSISRDDVVDGQQRAPITFNGANFSNHARLVVDGAPDGVGTGVNLDAPFSFVSSAQLDGLIDVSQNVSPGAHDLAIGDGGGISLPQELYVQCPGCPLPPRLFRLEDANPTPGRPPLSALYKGKQGIVTVYGHNLKDNSPVVTISGGGLTFIPNITNLQHLDAGNVDYFNLVIDVAADATGGYRELRVLTNGGRSNALLLTLLAQPLIPFITGVKNEGATPCALRPGLNNLTITGGFFALSTKVTVSYRDSSNVNVLGENTTLVNHSTLTTQINVAGAAPESFTVTAETVSGASQEFVVSCNPTGAPILYSATPSSVTRGTEAWVKLRGENINHGRLFFETSGSDPAADVINGPVLAATGDQSKSLVLKIRAYPGDHRGSCLFYFVDDAGRVSNPIGLRIDTSVDYNGTSFPLIEILSPNTIGQGSEGDFVVHGKYLLSFDGPYLRCNNPGITLSNVVVDPNTTDIHFHMKAAADAPVTGDDATNISLYNPLALTVTAPSPTPTPQITSVIPAPVSRNSTLWVKVSGTNFGANPTITTDDARTIVENQYNEQSSDPDHFKIGLLHVEVDAPEPFHLRVQNNTTFKVSPPFSLSAVNDASGMPHVQGNDAFVVHRGQTLTNVRYNGTNLKSASQVNTTNLHGVHISNLASDNNAGTFITFTVTADADATLSRDEPTNLTMTSPYGTSNPFAIRIDQ